MVLVRTDGLTFCGSLRLVGTTLPADHRTGIRGFLGFVLCIVVYARETQVISVATAD